MHSRSTPPPAGLLLPFLWWWSSPDVGDLALELEGRVLDVIAQARTLDASELRHGAVRAVPLNGFEAVGRQPEKALHEGGVVQGDLEARRRGRREGLVRGERLLVLPLQLRLDLDELPLGGLAHRVPLVAQLGEALGARLLGRGPLRLLWVELRRTLLPLAWLLLLLLQEDGRGRLDKTREVALLCELRKARAVLVGAGPLWRRRLAREGLHRESVRRVLLRVEKLLDRGQQPRHGQREERGVEADRHLRMKEQLGRGVGLLLVLGGPAHLHRGVLQLRGAHQLTTDVAPGVVGLDLLVDRVHPYRGTHRLLLRREELRGVAVPPCL
mmetsp:Transcript_5916/g.13782  ORF Transcript_5916/g.13782 Transcript_5916/m.13782 type:complete len:327 (+) Transcript_5916:348-1328(+)